MATTEISKHKLQFIMLLKKKNLHNLATSTMPIPHSSIHLVEILLFYFTDTFLEIFQSLSLHFGAKKSVFGNLRSSKNGGKGWRRSNIHLHSTEVGAW